MPTNQLCVSRISVYVCGAKWRRSNSACYQIVQAHLGLHQHYSGHHPVPVKPELRTDAEEPSAQNEAEVSNTHMHEEQPGLDLSLN